MTEELFFHNGLAFATQYLDSKDRFLLDALVVVLDRMTEEHFFLLDIRLAMPMAYLGEIKTGWLLAALVVFLDRMTEEHFF